ncbi:MAG: NUDIX hydrolase [Elusimicrobiales bacterium]|jgi:8-oxo-dGTP pyrophosphatase MutT (NUDIX family)
MTPGGRRKVVNIVLYDRKKRFLLQLRTKNAPLLPGYWAFFGGGMKPGESPQEALERESLEELAFSPAAAAPAAEHDFVCGGRKMRRYVFFQRYTSDKSALRLGEGAGWGWLNLAQACKLRMCRRDRKMLKFLHSRI